MEQNHSFAGSLVLALVAGACLIVGAALRPILEFLGSLILSLSEGKRDDQRAARDARAEGERRISHIGTLAQYGFRVITNRDLQCSLSHDCADEVDEMSRLLLGGPKEPTPDTEDLLRRARTLCAHWRTLATDLWIGTEEEKSQRSRELMDTLAEIVNVAAKEFRPALRAVWGRR